jgi:mycothiol synthase
MKLKIRSYQSEEDYSRMRTFLREIFIKNSRRMLSWPVARLDYWRWHGILNLGDGTLQEGVYLWETDQGEIAAILNREGPGQAFLQVHPAYKSVALEDQMISVAEETFRRPVGNGGFKLWVWSDSGDIPRQRSLKKRGYNHIPEADERQWRCSLEFPVPKQALRAGYTIRALDSPTELPLRSWASWRAFHSREPDEKYQQDWSWYLNIQSAPLYRPDLDLVAIAPSGEVAAFTTIWYDVVTQSGFFEPVGTMPEHQRSGLGRALLCEGKRRLKRLGATQCMVSGSSIPANALYQSVLGPVYDAYLPWEKRWA